MPPRIGIKGILDTAEFDYELPTSLIAQEPLPDRASSRLMIVDRQSGDIRHRSFSDIVDYLSASDCLVINETKVLPARLIGNKITGGKVEIFLLKEVEEGLWMALCRPAKRLIPGTTVKMSGGVEALIVEDRGEGTRLVKFTPSATFRRRLAEIGEVPLPPYIHKVLAESGRYQTVYAAEEGSVAAPTAGLHFTKSLLGKVADQGVTIARLTLDIGLDTFRPVTAARIEDHKIHSEKFSLTPDAARIINHAREGGGKIMAVGTTSVRALESAVDSGHLRAKSGETRLFIYPGYKFQVVDRLLTNFHLPKSTLLMLVAALAGRDLILKAYNEAIKEKYRFFSFGDAMLIV